MISSISGKSFHFPFLYFVIFVLQYFPFHVVYKTILCDFRHEARDVLRNAVHASEHDAVIFAGHGCTGAVHKLINALDLCEPPVVFVGPCEHHSNLLPWREKGAKVTLTVFTFISL